MTRRRCRRRAGSMFEYSSFATGKEGPVTMNGHLEVGSAEGEFDAKVGELVLGAAQRE